MAKTLIHERKGASPEEVSSNLKILVLVICTNFQKLWVAIIEREPSPQFMQEQVWAEWTWVNQTTWKLEPNQVVSTKVHLCAAVGKEIELVPIGEEQVVNIIA